MWNELARQDEREVLGSELEADWEGRDGRDALGMWNDECGMWNCRDGRDGGDFEVFRTSISNFTF